MRLLRTGVKTLRDAARANGYVRASRHAAIDWDVLAR